VPGRNRFLIYSSALRICHALVSVEGANMRPCPYCAKTLKTGAKSSHSATTNLVHCICVRLSVYTALGNRENERQGIAS